VTSSSTSTTGASSAFDTGRTSADYAGNTNSDISSRMTEWRLSDAEIQSDLDRGVTIVRTKDSAVGAPSGTTDDEVIKTMVKGKLQADSETSKAMFEVEAKNGEVMLKGTADSAAMIARGIALALDTQGVTKVSSDVKLNGKVD
jgi:hypothetical protein